MATATKQKDGVVDDPSGVKAPAENAPGPKPLEASGEVHAVDLRPRIEPRDRSTFIGAVHARDESVDVPKDFDVFGSSDGERDKGTIDLKGKTVDVFQIVATNSTLVFRFDKQTFVLSAEQARSLQTDLHGVTANIVT
jgi:hypothetical protein